MSTTTNFKRIALVVVAALGMGVLSSVPATAATSGLTITVTNGTSGAVGTKSDSSNAATIQIAALLGATDSMIVTAVQKSIPTGAVVTPVFYNLDSSTPTLSNSTYKVESNLVTAIDPSTAGGVFSVDGGSNRVGAGTAGVNNNTPDTLSATAGFRITNLTNDANINHKFGLQLDSSLSTTRSSGTYTYTIVVKTFETKPNVGLVATTTTTKDVSIVIAALASESTTIAPGSSTAFIGTGTAATSDAVISALATASTTAAAYVRVRTYNANGDAKPESVTATISGAGLLSFGGISGGSLTIAADGDDNISVLPDGRAGTATITISTTTRSFPAKTMSFYAAAPKTLTASVATPNLAVGSNTDTIRVTAVDASGINWAGTVYLYASSATDAAIAGSATPFACTWSSTYNWHSCDVTGTAAGTAKFKAIDAATVATATVTSNEVSAVVNDKAVASVKLSFDKATYAPGERARIYVTPLDSAGKEIAAATFANLLATGGISTASALSYAGSTTTADSLTAVSITTKANSSSTSGAKAGSMEYTVYMPVAGGTVTISATGGSTLPVAARSCICICNSYRLRSCCTCCSISSCNNCCIT